MKPGDIVTGVESGKGFEILEHVAYRGKVGCTDPRCTRDGNPTRCFGWHCPKCHESCSIQGHHVCKAKDENDGGEENHAQH